MSLRRVLLRPLSRVYAAGLALERGAERALRRERRTLKGVVISVGSVSAGGAGKTPMVLLLAEVLSRREYAVRILTRGYGREARTIERVDPAGEAAHFGDEAMLLARRSGVPVIVGADRYAAGLLAEDLEAGDAGRTIVHLLDDGLQHRRLHRDLDVVLLTRRDVEDTLLPAGDLREPLSALRRADVLVLREEEAESLRPVVEELLRTRQRSETRWQAMPPFWLVRRSVRFAAEARRFAPEAARTGPGEPPVRAVSALAFCGIARPEGFLEMLRGAGVDTVRTVLFADHHRYRERDVERLVRKARTSGADGFVTTEKDAVKLTDTMRRVLEAAGPLRVAELDVAFVDERAAMEELIGLVARLDRRRRAGRR